jgi:RNA polymerase sigma-70 factor (ECF subfamily)
MAYLCQSYWQPLYAYALRQGHSRDAAQDLTQGFFLGLLEGRYVKNVKTGRGRFRSFLLGCFKHFLAHEWTKGQALKRGGGQQPLSLDFERVVEVPSNRLSPDKSYDRQWALTVLDNVVDELEERYRERGKAQLFQALRPALSGGRSDYEPMTVASALGMSEGAVKVAAHRLRRQYRDTLRRQIAQTLDPDQSVESELEYLLSVL